MKENDQKKELYLTGLFQPFNFAFQHYFGSSLSDSSVVFTVHEVLVYLNGFFTLGVMEIRLFKFCLKQIKTVDPCFKIVLFSVLLKKNTKKVHPIEK